MVRKMTFTAGLCLLLTLLLAACGGGKTTAESTPLDMEALTEELRGLCGEDLYLLEEETLPLTYGELDWEKAIAYASSGASAEEVALFQAADEEAAKAIFTALEERLAERLESYADYLPDEAEKLKQALLKQEGCYVVVCVSADTAAAKEILGKYFE